MRAKSIPIGIVYFLLCCISIKLKKSYWTEKQVEIPAPISIQLATTAFMTKFGIEAYAAIFSFRDCPELRSQCRIIKTPKAKANAEVLVFFSFDYSLYVHEYAAWTTRNSEHFYVFFGVDPPQLMANLDYEPQNFFNLTMSYYPHSDVYIPYGWIVERANGKVRNFTQTPYTSCQRNQSIETKDSHKVYRRKKRIAVSISSNCMLDFSGRQLLWQDLRKIIRIDTYGKCRESPRPDLLPLEDYHEDCLYRKNKVFKIDEWAFSRCLYRMQFDYYFYFSLESNVCYRYHTEKLYQVLSYQLIPVVFKRSIAAEHVPPTAFVAVDDYETISDLAVALLKISSDEKLYHSYFAWKNCYRTVLNVFHDFDYRKEQASLTNAGCDLCKTVIKRKLGRRRKSYTSMYEWFAMSGKACREDFVQHHFKMPRKCFSRNI